MTSNSDMFGNFCVCNVLSQSLCVWRIHVTVKLLVLIVVIHSNICIE